MKNPCFFLTVGEHCESRPGLDVDRCVTHPCQSWNVPCQMRVTHHHWTHGGTTTANGATPKWQLKQCSHNLWRLVTLAHRSVLGNMSHDRDSSTLTGVTHPCQSCNVPHQLHVTHHCWTHGRMMTTNGAVLKWWLKQCSHNLFDCQCVNLFALQDDSLCFCSCCLTGTAAGEKPHHLNNHTR